MGADQSVPLDPQVILQACSPCTFSALALGTLTHLAGIKCPEFLKLEFDLSHSKLHGEGSLKEAISACMAPTNKTSRRPPGNHMICGFCYNFVFEFCRWQLGDSVCTVVHQLRGQIDSDRADRVCIPTSSTRQGQGCEPVSGHISSFILVGSQRKRVNKLLSNIQYVWRTNWTYFYVSWDVTSSEPNHKS